MIYDTLLFWTLVMLIVCLSQTRKQEWKNNRKITFINNDFVFVDYSSVNHRDAQLEYVDQMLK